MCFDVPKIVRSPGCDHEHDEESQNGRDIKIDILEAYIWISESFRVKSGFYRSAGGYRNPSGSILGLMGLSGEEEGRPGQATRPSPSSANWTRRGRPPFLPLSLLLPPSPTPTRKGGVLLRVGVGLPPWRALLLGRPPPPLLLYIQGQGHL